MSERVYWLGFSAFSGIGPAKFQLLLEHFGSAHTAWEVPLKELEESSIGKVISAKFVAFRETFSLDHYLQKLEQKRVNFVTRQDDLYPPQLKEISKAPFVLFYTGNSDLFRGSTPKIAVVGARKVTNYGREVTEVFTQSLVGTGYCIVSGLAMGVDAVAHQTAIDHGGKTIAVLGCGVDCCYPRENQTLYDAILEKDGLIVSEYPLGQQPTIGSFPARNRIVAALSAGIVVTEGAEDSGALITAEFGLQLGRKVFAVPGPITSSLSKGPYKLIAKGGKLVTSGEEIIRELGVKNYELRKERTVIKGETKEEQMVLDLLANEALSFDTLVRKGDIDSSQLGSLLSLMELKGLIKIGGNGYYSLHEEPSP